MSDADIIEAVQETVKDPFCDEKNPKIITFHDVTSASFKIKGGIEYTPCPVSSFFGFPAEISTNLYRNLIEIAFE